MNNFLFITVSKMLFATVMMSTDFSKKLRSIINPQNGGLFIDSSAVSLKAVLLHNGNRLPSIPVAHSTHLKENYQDVKVMYSASQAGQELLRGELCH